MEQYYFKMLVLDTASILETNATEIRTVSNVSFER